MVTAWKNSKWTDAVIAKVNRRMLEVESAVEAGLVHAATEGRLRHIIPVRDEVPEGEAVLRSAFEGKLP